MIRAEPITTALSRHIARVLVGPSLDTELAAAGFDPADARESALRFARGTAAEAGYGHSETRVEAEAVAFLAGLVVGRTVEEES